jgi:hypothetical protein
MDKKTKRKPTGAAAMGAGPGRPKGVPNKMTAAVKDVIAQAADDLGGKDRLVEWVREDPQNERAFWATIYPKLLPLQLTGENGGPVRIAAVEWTVVEAQA